MRSQLPPRRQEKAGAAERQLHDDGRQPLAHPLQVRQSERGVPSEADRPQIVDVFDAVRFVDVQVAQRRQREIGRSPLLAVDAGQAFLRDHALGEEYAGLLAQQRDHAAFEFADRAAAAVEIRESFGEGMPGKGGERLPRAGLPMMREAPGTAGAQLPIVLRRCRSRVSLLGSHPIALASVREFGIRAGCAVRRKRLSAACGPVP